MVTTLPIVYIVDASVAVTGAFVAARNTSCCLKELTHTVLVLPSNHTIPNEELRDFWRVETMPMPRLSKNARAMLSYLPTLFMGTWQLHRRMRRDGATRLMLNDFYLMHGALLRLLGYRGTIVTWVRCDPARFAGFLARPMLWLVTISATHMVAVSAYIQALLPFPSQRLYDYYAGTARTPKHWQPNDPKTFVSIGNYIRGKGQDVALKAFAIAAAQDPTIHLAFYGGDMGLSKNRDYREELECMAAALGIHTRVTFGAFVADTASVLETAYAALNFSMSESFSMTVLEASGTGVPVIATMSGGPQEIIRDNITGYLIPVGDIQAAADRILALARDTEAATTMGQAGAAWVQEKFSAAAFTRQLHTIVLSA